MIAQITHTSSAITSSAQTVSYGMTKKCVNYQREPAGGGLGRGRPGVVYIGAGIVAIAIIVLLIILIF